MTGPHWNCLIQAIYIAQLLHRKTQYVKGAMWNHSSTHGLCKLLLCCKLLQCVEDSHVWWKHGSSQHWDTKWNLGPCQDWEEHLLHIPAESMICGAHVICATHSLANGHKWRSYWHETAVGCEECVYDLCDGPGSLEYFFKKKKIWSIKHNLSLLIVLGYVTRLCGDDSYLPF